MGKVILLTCITIILMTTACKKKTETVYSDCVEDKITAVKNLQGTQHILKITRPDGSLYWFVGGAIDARDEMVNDDCELVCMSNCECDGSVILCDSTHFDFPQETIWER